MRDPCPPFCQADRVLVGRVHNCRPRPVAAPAPAPSPAKPAANRIESLVANTVANGDGVANRSTTYRHRDPAKRRAYMCELMRRRRQAAKRAEP